MFFEILLYFFLPLRESINLVVVTFSFSLILAFLYWFLSFVYLDGFVLDK